MKTVAGLVPFQEKPNILVTNLIKVSITKKNIGLLFQYAQLCTLTHAEKR